MVIAISSGIFPFFDSNNYLLRASPKESDVDSEIRIEISTFRY